MDKTVQATNDEFVAVSPDGLFYWPPTSIEEARQTIVKRSIYEGEPGWEIIPLWLAMEHLDREGHQLHMTVQREEVV